MSNHWGSYMLNDVLRLLDAEGLFEDLGKERTQDITLKILRIGMENDGNANEVLDGMGPRTGVCFYCQRAVEEFADDEWCKECHEEHLRLVRAMDSR